MAKQIPQQRGTQVSKPQAYVSPQAQQAKTFRRRAAITGGAFLAAVATLVGVTTGGGSQSSTPGTKAGPPANTRDDATPRVEDPIAPPPVAASLGRTTNAVEPSPTDVSAPVRQLVKQGLSAAPKDDELTAGTYYPACGGQMVRLAGSNGVAFNLVMMPGSSLDSDFHRVPELDTMSIMAVSEDRSILPTQALYPGVKVEAWGAPGLVGATTEGQSREEWDHSAAFSEAQSGPSFLNGMTDFNVGRFNGEGRVKISIQFDRGNGVETAEAIADVERVVSEDGRTTFGVQSFEAPMSERTFTKNQNICGLGGI